ncbi:MAG TPA: trehalose-phosphatase [Burkholderiaceae bacterium]|nr:trehalose-phosphatase [Burkholderiaceae bacterium]
MPSLFSEKGFGRLDQIASPGLLCLFDFDGTLAPITPRPEEAFLPPEIRQRLAELSRYAPIGVITGRSLTDIRARMDFETDYLVGNHGLEGIPGMEQASRAYEMLCVSWKEQLTAALQDHVTYDPAIQVEDKRYSLSVHYRRVRDQVETELRLGRLLGQLIPAPRIIGGKSVFNLLPANAVDKGLAIVHLLRISSAPGAIYVGDDVTDEDVFRLRRRDVLTIRVGNDAQSAAEFFLDRRDDVPLLLDELIGRLEQPRIELLSESESTNHE